MIKIGLLPFYIELYDAVVPEVRTRLEAFYETMAQRLENEKITVVRSPFCRLKEEFKQAVNIFEEAGVCCIVTLHMAYSPSLESAEVLAKTLLPIVVLDTTETYDFGSGQFPDEIIYCHGIHGVMDMCSLLQQNGKSFAIAAGHPEHSDVVSRTCGFVRAAYAARRLSGSKTGLIGGTFEGMGDFAITAQEMKNRFGVEVVIPESFAVEVLQSEVTDKEITDEIKRDFDRFSHLEKISQSVHIRSTRDGLALRSWVNRESLQALSVNFPRVSESGFETMPFMELCKLMTQGIGYAGEGDVLTASFTGALMQGFSDVSFVEIFCPDWKGNTLFLSHMGEMNIHLTDRKPEMAEKEFMYGEAKNPIACYGCYKSGQAVFINVFRTANDFGLLAAPVEMIEPGKDNFCGNIRGWMKPEKPVAEFLEAISRAGVTHHSILIYDATPEQVAFFGKLLDMPVTII